MKYFFSLLLPLLSFMMLTSCSNVDKELLGKIKAEAEMAPPEVTTTVNAISAMIEQVKLAPATVQSQAEYTQFSTTLNSLIPKTLGTRSEYEENLIKLRNLAAQYQDGKIETAEAFAQFEAITLAMKGNKEVLTSMASYVQGLPNEFAQMMETINSKQ